MISTVGGYKVTIAGVFATVYAILFGKLIKHMFIGKMDKKMKNGSLGGPEIKEVK